MREIKFRAWDSKNKKMKYQENGTRFYDSGGVFPCEVIEITHVHHGWEWMQYTGLKDKNGREIYESDIVMFNGGLKVIEWVDAGFNILSGKEYNIVGNIYEDEELVP